MNQNLPVDRFLRLLEIVAHEYEDAPAIKAAVLNRFIDEIESLLAIWKRAEVFSARYL
ncbi:MAG: hypothetical protein L3K24_03545 [Gammaproteobacteria bacterium]|nr:hypothetical protein [Gammaproteobacteria bacterium]